MYMYNFMAIYLRQRKQAHIGIGRNKSKSSFSKVKRELIYVPLVQCGPAAHHVASLLLLQIAQTHCEHDQEHGPVHGG